MPPYNYRTLHNLTICNFNANGLKRQRSEFITFLDRHNIDLICISETHLVPNEIFKIPKYETYRNDRISQEASGGVAIAIKKSLRHNSYSLPSLTSIEAVCVQIYLENSTTMKIISAYKPPNLRLSENDIRVMFEGNDPTIALGDFNCKSTLWGCRTNNPNGTRLEAMSLNHNVVVIAPDEPTHYPYRNDHQPDILDIMLLKNAITPTEQQVLPELDSDHLPILYSFFHKLEERSLAPRLVNGRVDWEMFQLNLNDRFEAAKSLSSSDDIDRTIVKLNRSITHAIHTSTVETRNKRNAYSHRTPPHYIIKLIKEKHTLRRQWQNSRDRRLKNQLNQLTHRIRWELEKFRINSYRTYINDLEPGDPTLWRATKQLLQQPQSIPTLKVNNTYFNTDKEKCILFSEHLATVYDEAPPDDEDLDNEVTAHARNHVPIGPFADFQHTNPDEISKIIKNLPTKKSPGHDLITNIILKNLTRKALANLATTFNACLRIGYFPRTWKHAEIILFHKPGKVKSNPTSYRPISLLPTLGKLLEKIILTRLNTYIIDNNIIPPIQFGFRQNHSTVHQLLRINEIIVNGFENKQNTVIAFLDVAQAFDKVWIDGLIFKLLHLHPPNYLVGIVVSFLKNRTFVVRLNGEYSTVKTIHAGVPQGSILGPTLYNIFVSDIPTSAITSTAMYADDTAFIAQHENVNEAADQLQISLNTFCQWCKKWRITLNEAKCQAKIFTLRRPTNPPQITINNHQIPWNGKHETIKYLGVHFDRRLTWKYHINHKLSQTHIRLRLLYPMINKRSPLKIECGLLLYKSILRPILTYACPVWGTASRTSLKKVQALQNKVLRIIANAPWFVRNTQIHQELGIPPIQEFIKKSAETFFNKLADCPGAVHFQLGKRSQERRLKKRLPQDILLSTDEETTEESE